MEQQREAGTLGMWSFLITEIMFFGGMFTAYLVYRSMYFDAFAHASGILDITLGTFNTGVLIGSSLTMAMAVYFAQQGNRKLLTYFLLATVVLGAVFLRVKYIEYHQKFEEHVFPAGDFEWPPLEQPKPTIAQDILRVFWLASPPQAATTEPLQRTYTHVNTAFAEQESPLSVAGQAVESESGQSMKGHVRMYFFLYFAMTGFHALHMIIGMGLLLMLAWQSWHGKFSKEYHSYIEFTGLYWHFVDIVWIFLFPLLYLIDRHL